MTYHSRNWRKSWIATRMWSAIMSLASASQMEMLLPILRVFLACQWITCWAWRNQRCYQSVVWTKSSKWSLPHCVWNSPTDLQRKQKADSPPDGDHQWYPWGIYNREGLKYKSQEWCLAVLSPTRRWKHCFFVLISPIDHRNIDCQTPGRMAIKPSCRAFFVGFYRKKVYSDLKH